MAKPLLPASLWRAASLLAGAALVVALALLAQRPPAARGPEAPPEAFSAHRAHTHLAWIAAEPHPVGSAAHARVRTRLVQELKTLGLEVHTQRAEVPIPRRGALVGVENVLARKAGTGGGGAVLLACHYDSVPGSFGAADDGAGVATLLEVARALQHRPPLKQDLILLVTDGEEVGLLGATAFVQHHPWAREVRAVVNLEARGTGGLTYLFETTSPNGGLVAALAEATPDATANSVAYEVYRRMPNNTDLTEFRKLGVPGMGFAFIDRPWDYHHPTDHASRLDLGSLQQMGDATLGLAQVLGRGEASRGGGDAVYFNLWGRHLVRYPASLVPLLSLVSVLLLGVVRWRQREVVGGAPILRALGLLGATLVLAGGLGALAWLGVVQVHRLWGVPEAFARIYNGWYLLPLVAAALAATAGLLRVAERSGALPGLATAVWGLWTLAGILLGVAVPGASYLIHLPLLLALLGAALAPGRDWAQLPAALSALLLFPTLAASVVTGLGLGAGLAGGLTALFTLVLVLLGPGVTVLRRGRLLTLTVGALSLAGLVAGGLWARHTFQGRTFVSLRHHTHLDTGRAWWVAERRHLGPWTATWLPSPTPGHPSWVGDGQVNPGSQATFLHQEAPLLPVPQPELRILSDATEAGLRTLRLHIDAPGAEEVWVRYDPERFLRASVSGHLLRSVPFTRDGQQVRPLEPALNRLQLLGLPPGPVEVSLVLAAAPEATPIGLQARYPGLPEALGDRARPPQGLQPIGEGNVRWVTRTHWAK